MIANDGQSTTAQPQQTADARSEGSAIGSSGITFLGAIGFGKADARGAGSMSVVRIHKSVLLDNVVGGCTNVENNATRRGLIDAHTNELLCLAFGCESHRAVSTLKISNERSDVLVVQYLRSRKLLFVRNADAGVVSGENHGNARSASSENVQARIAERTAKAVVGVPSVTARVPQTGRSFAAIQGFVQSETHALAARGML
jgi:hypothetical protein